MTAPMENNELPVYTVRRAATRPGRDGQWDGPAWNGAAVIDVAQFHPETFKHFPKVQAKMVYDDEGVYGIFRVEDRYVICRHVGYMEEVFMDSCVEFFVKPKAGKGYMNFEMNCGGSLLLFYIADATRINDPLRPDDEFADYTRVPWDDAEPVRIYHSLPHTVMPEIKDEVEWTLEFHIPFSVLEVYVGPLGPIGGQEWRANFNKCADGCSHPHWATWAPIGEKLNLHQPDKFGILRFE